MVGDLGYLAGIELPELKLSDFTIDGYHKEASSEECMGKWIPEIYHKFAKRARAVKRLQNAHEDLESKRSRPAVRPKWVAGHRKQWRSVAFKKQRAVHEAKFAKNHYYS